MLAMNLESLDTTRPLKKSDHLRLIEKELKDGELKGVGQDVLELASRDFFYKHLKRLNLKWFSGSNTTDLYSSLKNSELGPLEVAMAILPRGYFCFQTALFFNSLSNQVPSNFYLATDRLSAPSSKRNVTLSDEELIDYFMKGSRDLKNYCVWRKSKIYIAQRSFFAPEGLLRKKISEAGRDIEIIFSDCERSLIDAAVSPEFCGGVLSVREAYELAKGKFKIKRMIEYYRAMDLAFPYWQRVGFWLSSAGLKSAAEEWLDAFGKPKQDFYLAHGFRSDWAYHPEWRVFAPGGVV